LLRDFVAPRAERSFGVLHDVSLVHERHGLSAVLDRVPDRLPDQSLGAGLAHRLHPDPTVLAHPRMELPVQDLDHPAGFRRAFLPLDSGVDVLGALSKDYDVEAFRMGNGAWDARDPVDRPHVGVKVEYLPQPHVERAEASTD